MLFIMVTSRMSQLHGVSLPPSFLLLQVGRPSDIWSLGCILYLMVYRRTPFEHIKNKMMKWHAISNPSTPIPFPELSNKAALDVMQVKCVWVGVVCRGCGVLGAALCTGCDAGEVCLCANVMQVCYTQISICVCNTSVKIGVSSHYLLSLTEVSQTKPKGASNDR